jgi:hypothetical protein
VAFVPKLQANQDLIARLDNDSENAVSENYIGTVWFGSAGFPQPLQDNLPLVSAPRY